MYQNALRWDLSECDGSDLHELHRVRPGHRRRAARVAPQPHDGPAPAPPPARSLRLVRRSQARGKPAPSAAGHSRRVNLILNMASRADRRLAAIATTNGAA